MAAQAAIHDFLYLPGASSEKDVDCGLRRHDGVQFV
jgi:hypothetical protein